MRKFSMCFIIAIAFVCTMCSASATGGLSYDVTYTVNGAAVNISYSVANAENESHGINLFAVLYKNLSAESVTASSLTAAPGATVGGRMQIAVPDGAREQYSVKFLAWEDMRTLRSIGGFKHIRDIEPYLREKSIPISAMGGEIFNLYMNCDSVIGANPDAMHIVGYNPQKFEVVDLCALTAEKELLPCETDGCGIIISEADFQNGKLIFNFSSDKGRNSGINNVVVFKALADVENEEITYHIQ